LLENTGKFDKENSMVDELKLTIDALAVKGKGILAADESTSTIGKRFSQIGLDNTAENRRIYRSLLAQTDGLEGFISGVILFEETLQQSTDDNINIAHKFAQKGIVPGIKVDHGLVPLSPGSVENATQGLDGLATRLENYKQQGARFAKWRCVYTIGENLPSQYAIHHNAETLARYARICQDLQIVPIVEPEVLMDGAHTLEDCEKATESVLHAVFNALNQHNVDLSTIILKPNMIVAGKNCSKQASPEEVAAATVRVLKNCVPAIVPSIKFLSGGQSAEEATKHLKLINQHPETLPWRLSFSFGRALQADCLNAWSGQESLISKAQEVLLNVAKANGEVVV
jgi:fructose-bisphosphate aldolase class I